MTASRSLWQVKLLVFLAIGWNGALARAGIIFGDVSIERIMDLPFPALGQTVNAYGSALAAANAQGNAGAMSSLDQLKLSVTNGPPVTFTSTPVVATEGPLFSGPNSAQASARIDLGGSSLGASSFTADSSQSLQYTLNKTGPLHGQLAASAESRDPLTTGTKGFGGMQLPKAIILSQTVLATGIASFPAGSISGPLGMIAPGAFNNPDTLFTSPPPGATLMYDLTATRSSSGLNVLFTPGTSNANFLFTFDRTPAQIEQAYQNYLNGAGTEYLFTVTITLEAAQDNVTTYNQDVLSGVVPEPSSFMLLALGCAALLSVKACRFGARI